MGFWLNIEGAETVQLGLENILTIEFKTDTPDDSNARSTDKGVTALIGKIITAVDSDPFDSTKQLDLWSLVPAENADCYHKVKNDVISASQVVRQILFPNAFLVDYKEHYGDVEGVVRLNC